MPVVYGDIHSGNCYKVALLCSQLNIQHEWREVLITRGDTKTSDFLAMNPAGQIPLVVLDDGAVLTQSNAILHYFAQGSALLPADSLMHFRVLEWQFFEQYSHEPNIAVRRFIKKYEGLPAARQAEFDAREAGSYRALNVMEKRLVDHEFLVADHYTLADISLYAYTLADISLYAYTHVADEAGLDLERYPGIRRWLGTVAAQPGYIAMESLP